MMLDFTNWTNLSESFAFDPDARYPDPTFGIEAGAVNTNKTFAGGEGGNWGGSMPRALAFAKVANDFLKRNILSSQKRTRVLTASGAVSDHYTGSETSYAVDLATKGEEGDALLAHLMQWFGHPEYKGGSWFNVTKNGYRYQVGWRVAGHFDHIHVGVRKVGTSSRDVSDIQKAKTRIKTVIGNTFGERLLNNPGFLQWLYVNSQGAFKNMKATDIDQVVKDPKNKEWFKTKFKVDDNGFPLDEMATPSTQTPVTVGLGEIKKEDTDIKKIAATVINKLEGGYYHPNMMAKDPSRFKDYGFSGETLFGLDRHAGHDLFYKTKRKVSDVRDNLKHIEAGEYEWASPEAKEFWTTVDSMGAKDKWEWNSKGGANEARLVDLASGIIAKQWDVLSQRYLSNEALAIIKKDGRLLFNFVYAVWNGSSWFKKWAEAINEKVKAGEKNPDALLQFIVGLRETEGLDKNSKPNSLIARGAQKIKKIVGLA